MTVNVFLPIYTDEPTGIEMVPAQDMLKQQELLGSYQGGTVGIIPGRSTSAGIGAG